MSSSASASSTSWLTARFDDEDAVAKVVESSDVFIVDFGVDISHPRAID